MARELNEWTQHELCDLLPITPAALSQIERGHTRPTVGTLEALAHVTGCPPEFFVRRFGDRPMGGFFRSTKTASARRRRRSLARARLLHDLTEVMEEYVGLPMVNVPNIEVDLKDRSGLEDAALEVRHQWGVEPGPIGHVVRLLERNGIVVVRSQLFHRDIDAFSVFFSDRPIVVLASDKGVTARSRMDAAHELAHQILHRNVNPMEPGIETQATDFGSAFLMPAPMIRKELPKDTDWSALMDLKRRWRVSLHALIWRAYRLGVWEERQFDNARKVLSARGWTKQEPGDQQLGPVEMPMLLHRALDTLATLGHEVDDLAAEGALPAHQVHAILQLTKADKPVIEV